MSSTHHSQSSQSASSCSHRGSSCRWGGNWSAANIGAIVLGFIVWVPLGFATLLWAATGHAIDDLPRWLRDRWRQIRAFGAQAREGSDNAVFDEYQQTQHERIHEIKEEIRRRAEAFRNFRHDARRRQDQREFDEFMSTNPGHDGPRD
ncbi:MAG: DUF2852 domain-containing protein [Rhodocyclaceae bacterium]|nr:DUF2852 domain-containing protein [Rhodocyclaceae bacterium]